ncbi:hypothetical protein EW026_g7095 [Hermanssonia centrifuga]|uniref:NAD(+) diphosphatase n=1 Tax=Hermanssonia centrifuga TaxID=98765 RepID=A0A4S4K9Z0_9APHY|nr:hypothetical protein EW026_g7095 [Hermanssonia centrifuga]
MDHLQSRATPTCFSKRLSESVSRSAFHVGCQHDGEVAADEVKELQAARLHGPGIVFLGLHETDPEAAEALPSSDFSAKGNAAEVAAKVKGTPYFSLDVSGVEEKQVDEVLQKSEAGKNGATFAFVDGRQAMSSMDYVVGAIYAEARAMVDWNARNKYCSACGSPVFSLWAGWKLACTTLLPWADNSGRSPCPTAVGLHNQSHPRTDPVVIMAVVNEVNDRILLGRNRKWPGKFYSALAGFIEPGESFEDAVKRELWEEAGLKVWGIQYHSTQPWPFPANLMIGFYAIADPSVPTRVDLDNELEDARWYTREEILAVLAVPGATTIRSRDLGEADKITAENLAGPQSASSTVAGSVPDEPPFKLPPLTAIAGVLVHDWAHDKVVITGTKGSPALKGSL